MLAVLRSSVCGSHSGDPAPVRNSVGRPPAVVASRGGAPSVVVSVLCETGFRVSSLPVLAPKCGPLCAAGRGGLWLRWPLRAGRRASSRSRAPVSSALAAGADFEALAKKYGQNGEKTWMTTRQYQHAPSMDNDTKNYIESLNNMSVNEIKNIKLSQGNLVLQVLDRKAMVTKYQAAVIKRNVDFSKDTYRTAYNKFSSFVSANATIDAIEKNAAKSGYKFNELNDITTSQHGVANIPATRDALKWIFEAKEGQVSPMYECGNNDHLLLVACTKIHPIGYRDLSDAQVKDIVKAEVIRDKKAEQIEAKLKGVNSIAAAKAKGGKLLAVNQVTFAAPVFVQATGSSEPALSGAVAATAKGKFVSAPVKGNAGVYLFQVQNKKQNAAKFNDAEQEARLRQRAMQSASNFMSELIIKAGVVDNRYLFF